MRRTSPLAFTLIELLMTVALIAVLAALAWPDFNQTSKARRLTESAERVQTLVDMCRAEAMNQSRRFRLVIRPDGSLAAQEQVDPILAPHVYNPVQEEWGRTRVLLEDVWIEAVQRLPEGPAPIRLVDQELQVPEIEIDPTRVDELDGNVKIDIEPDGSCPSLRLVLRDTQGKALLLTLDGRLGSIKVGDWEALPPEDVVRPEPLAEKEDVEIYRPEDFER